jgi:hypothetical protein
MKIDPIFWVGLVCSLIQVWSFKKRQGIIYLGVAWAGSILGAILGGLVDYQIQHFGWNCCPESFGAYTWFGFWVHALIVIAVYAVVTSGILNLLSIPIRRSDRRIMFTP